MDNKAATTPIRKPRKSKVVHTHCLSIDPDTGFVAANELAIVPNEKVPIGNYVPVKTGTKKDIDRIVKLINRKPFKAEKFIKL